MNSALRSVRTLGERPILAWANTGALNFQDQGTGADMLARALAALRDQGLHRYLIGVVDDKLLLEVPDDQGDAVGDRVRELMCGSADYYLAGYGVPADADVQIDNVWLH